jgi:hypothetical protein
MGHRNRNVLNASLQERDVFILRGGEGLQFFKASCVIWLELLALSCSFWMVRTPISRHSFRRGCSSEEKLGHTKVRVRVQLQHATLEAARIGYSLVISRRCFYHVWPLLWSSAEFLAADPEVRVRFPALQDFLRSSVSGTGSTQPREYNWGATWKKSSGSGLENRECGRRDPSRWPHGTPLSAVDTNFAEKRRSLGRHSSLAD